MSEGFSQVSIQQNHIDSFDRNKQKIAQFYQMDQKSLQLVSVGEKSDGSIHSYCEFTVKDKNNKSATLKLDCLRTKTKWTDKPHIP